MKIVYLAAIRLPTEKAHGLQILKTCEAFAATGAEVELMVPRNPEKQREDPFVYYGVPATFSITYLPSKISTYFGKIGFALSLVAFAEHAHARASFWKADVLYSRDALVLLQFLFAGKKFIYEAHTSPTPISKFVARRAAHVVVISQGLRLAYVQAGIPSERIIVAPDAIDPKTFAEDRPGAESTEAARARLGLPTDPNMQIALYIGRLDGWKGVDTLCEAAAHLPENVRVVIIGGEPAQVESFTRKYPRVTFLGYRPYRELANNQQAGDVLVLPNTGKNIDSVRYTSPLKLFTYMASGKPIVTADLPSIREILDDDSAFFFAPDDPALLARRILEALAHKETAISKATKAKLLVQEYTWQARAERILAAGLYLQP